SLTRDRYEGIANSGRFRVIRCPWFARYFSESEMRMNTQSAPTPERRSFLTRLNTGVASLAAIAVGGVAMAQQKSTTTTTRWQPARHEKDDWFDNLPGKHRLVFDTTTPERLGDALLFANNFMRVNRSDYGLENSDLAVVIVARHRSTPFGYNDAMWANGMALAARSQ